MQQIILVGAYNWTFLEVPLLLQMFQLMLPLAHQRTVAWDRDIVKLNSMKC